MIEHLNNKDVEKLNENLTTISARLGNMWLAFGKGLLTGFGSVLGAGLAIILIGWFLNVIGVIPALSNSATQWREAFQASSNDAKNYVAPAENTPAE